MASNQVRRKRGPSKSEVSGALSVAWSRAANGVGKGCFADTLETSTKTIDRAITGESLPELHTALASLIADQTALQEVFALYGGKFVPNTASAANDMDLVTDLSRTVAEYLARIADGKRCHIDTAVLANLFRPIIPQMQAIVDESDRSKGLEVA